MIDTNQFPANWKENIERFKPVEHIVVQSHEEAVSLMLRGYVVVDPRDQERNLKESFSHDR